MGSLHFPDGVILLPVQTCRLSRSLVWRLARILHSARTSQGASLGGSQQAACSHLASVGTSPQSTAFRRWREHHAGTRLGAPPPPRTRAVRSDRFTLLELAKPGSRSLPSVLSCISRSQSNSHRIREFRMTRRVIGALTRVWQSVRVASAGHVTECTDSNGRRLASAASGCGTTRTNEPARTRRPTLPTSATSTTPHTARAAVKYNRGKRTSADS
jgi:hypothetical protein